MASRGFTRQLLNVAANTSFLRPSLRDNPPMSLISSESVFELCMKGTHVQNGAKLTEELGDHGDVWPQRVARKLLPFAA